MKEKNNAYLATTYHSKQLGIFEDKVKEVETKSAELRKDK
jgi:hypothetical protein